MSDEQIKLYHSFSLYHCAVLLIFILQIQLSRPGARAVEKTRLPAKPKVLLEELLHVLSLSQENLLH